MARLSKKCHKKLTNFSAFSFFKHSSPVPKCSRPSPFRVGKIFIYDETNPDYHKIDLKALYTNHNAYHFKAKKQLSKNP